MCVLSEMSPSWALARGSFNIITSVRGMMGGCYQPEHFCLRIHVLTALEPNHSNVRPNHSDRMPSHSHISRRVLAFLIPKDSHIRWNYVRKQEFMAGVIVITSEWFYGKRSSWRGWLLWHDHIAGVVSMVLETRGRSDCYDISSSWTWQKLMASLL